MSTIEWTDETWNPTLGCDRVSPGCDGCYAIGSSRVRSGNPHPAIKAAHAGLTEHRDGRLDWTGQVNLLPDRLDKPLTWRKPRRVFIDSMSDLFHDQVPTEFITRVLATIARTPQHTYQLLTKRHARMRAVLSHPLTHRAVAGAVHGPIGVTYPDEVMPWPLRNLWVGVSVEDQKRADLRIPALLETPAAVRFLSCEPLLGPVDIRQWMTYECSQCYRRGPWENGTSTRLGDEADEYWCQVCGHENPLSACASPLLHWVIAGGESGRGARPMHPDWARSLRDQCARAWVPYFFKQWGDWGPALWVVRVCDPDVGWQGTDAELAAAKLEAEARGATHAIMGGGSLHEPSHRPWSLARTSLPSHTEPMRRWGKKAAGRELDGRTHDEFPRPIS